MDGGTTAGSVTNYELNDEGKFVNVDTGDEYPRGPDPIATDVLPQSLWDQHYADPPQGVEP